MSDLRSAVRHFCSEHRLRLNTDLGQHFLVDEETRDAIVAAADPRAGDHVVEIGPGIGVLTAALLERTPKVTAIEIDPRMIPLLKQFVRRTSKAAAVTEDFRIILGNALQVPMPDPPYTVAANIPYHITSPLLRHLCLESAPPRSMTLLIQREVAEKICDEEHRGLLTIVVGLFGAARIVRHVPPAAFLPPPKVHSSVLHIACYPQPLAPPERIDRVLKLVKHGFGQKRKMLRNTLGTLEGGMDLLARTEIDPARRPETLSVEEWLRLAVSW